MPNISHLLAQIMAGDELLAEFDLEMSKTRTTLERIPDTNMDFRPHEKSFSMQDLAGHLVNLPTWVNMTLTTTELDVSGPFERPKLETREQLLEAFDGTISAARTALAGATEEDMAVDWSLKMGGHTAFTVPRGSVIRSFVMNHMIHHRAQLTVYLRLLDVPVPGMYGPSADEK